MINSYDKRILTEVGREYLFDIVMDSKVLKDQLSFKEHIILCNQVKKLTYEEVITLLVTEDIRDFEGKFSKFLKYSLAAIAGGVFGGLGGPPVAMFALYLYRKATDTCERSCFMKIPFSTKRKICRYECQLSAAKKMEADIRSEIVKCSQFTYPKKCESKLQKEYIKWAKRVQLLTVKLNRAKLEGEEKRRKLAQKALEKRAKAINAGLDMSKDNILKFICESKQLRNRLSFRNHLDLYKTCQYIKEDVEPFKINPKTEKLVRQALFVGLFAVPIPLLSVTVTGLIKKFSNGCSIKCLAGHNISRELCSTKCKYLAAKYAVNFLNKELSKCSKSKDVIKCKKKIYNMLEEWKQTEAETKIKFESSLRNEVAKAKQRNLTLRGK